MDQVRTHVGKGLEHTIRGTLAMLIGVGVPVACEEATPYGVRAGLDTPVAREEVMPCGPASSARSSPVGLALAGRFEPRAQ